MSEHNPYSIEYKLFTIHEDLNPEFAFDIRQGMQVGDDLLNHLDNVLKALPKKEFDDVYVEIGSIKEKGRNHIDIIRQIIKRHNKSNPDALYRENKKGIYFVPRRFARSLDQSGILFQFELPEKSIPSRADIFVSGEQRLVAD